MGSRRPRIHSSILALLYVGYVIVLAKIRPDLAPPHVTLNQIFVGMMPFMVIQCIAVVLLYVFPGIGLWLPHVLYK